MKTCPHNYKTQKQPRCASIGGDKQTMVYPCKRILFSNKMSSQTMKRHGETLNAYAKWKKPVPKGYTLCDSNCNKTAGTVKRPVVAGAWEMGWGMNIQSVFGAVKLFYMNLQWLKNES